MPDYVLRDLVQYTLRAARSESAMGRAINSSDAGTVFNPDMSNPAELADFFNLLIGQINALNKLVLKLATEIDELRGT